MTTAYDDNKNGAATNEDIAQAMIDAAGDVTVAIGQKIHNPHKVDASKKHQFSEQFRAIYNRKLNASKKPS